MNRHPARPKAKTRASFEVFDSGGVWSMLIGKPLLEQLQAVHDYTNDTIVIPQTPHLIIIKNILKVPIDAQPEMPSKGPSTCFIIVSLPADVIDPRASESANIVKVEEQFIFQARHNALREHLEKYTTALAQVGAHIVTSDHRPSLEAVTNSSSITPCSLILFTAQDLLQSSPAAIWPIFQRESDNEEELGEILDLSTMSTATPGIYTRHTDPFNPNHVSEIIWSIKIGDDLSLEQQAQVRELCTEFADTFALAVSEVFPVDFKTFKLTFPEGTTFKTKVNQQPLTPPQREYLYKQLNELEKAGIIRCIKPEEVKAASPTALVQKAHGSGSLPVEELLHRINNQCAQHGLPTRNDLPPRPLKTANNGENKSTPKWRICQNFAEINKASQIAPIPQGDIRAKQQWLSGHR